MSFEYSNLIPADFQPNSKVWIYQSSRLFSISEAFEIEDKLTSYLANWKTHGTPVKGYANLFFGQFIVIMADESAAHVGGCSTDTLFRMIQDLELHYKVSLLNRMSLAFLIKDKVQVLPMSQIKHGIENAEVAAINYLRVYVKYNKDMAQVKSTCQKHFPHLSILYVVADICRPELLVEIEGQAVIG